MTMHNVLASLGLLFVLLGQPAQGTIITLTGGDPGEGYNPLPGLAYAYNINGPTYTIQSIPFVNWNVSGTPPAGLSITGSFGSFGFSAPAMGPDPSDIALANVLSSVVYDNSSFTLTLGNLIAGKSYQVDLFVWSPNDRGEDFTFNSGAIDNFTAVNNTAYDVQEFVPADGSGAITVTLTGAGNPVISGFSVTSVPEPSTVLLFVAGGLLLCAKRWR